MKIIKLLMPLAGLSMVITVASAQNANLNAPVSRQPTVGTEVRRNAVVAALYSVRNLSITGSVGLKG